MDDLFPSNRWRRWRVFVWTDLSPSCLLEPQVTASHTARHGCSPWCWTHWGPAHVRSRWSPVAGPVKQKHKNLWRRPVVVVQISTSPWWKCLSIIFIILTTPNYRQISAVSATFCLSWTYTPVQYNLQRIYEGTKHSVTVVWNWKYSIPLYDWTSSSSGNYLKCTFIVRYMSWSRPELIHHTK